MPGAAELTLRIVRKSYIAAGDERREVLHDVAFSGHGGEILALLGPSGVGKTTVLRIVLGLERDFTGSIVCPGGRAGVMFQEPRLLPWLTVAANLALVGGERAREIPQLLAEVGLAGTENLYPRALSLGMARRVALARALLGSPRLLCLDEPFASLDPRTAAELALLVARTARHLGALVLLSSHDLDQVLSIADRLLVLSGKPATLAADWPTNRTQQSANGAALQIKQDLLTRFPFLRAEAEATP